MKQINIAKDFSDTPGGRNTSDGRFSGELFRKEILEPAFKDGHENITIILDGTFGYPPSFLEESFGGLVRTKKWKKKEILKRLVLVSNEDQSLVNKINKYIESADK